MRLIATTAIFLLAASQPRHDRGASLLPFGPVWSRELPFGDAVRAVPGESRWLMWTPTRIDARPWTTPESEPSWSLELATSAPPVVGDGRVFIAADDQVFACSELTGRVEWRLPLDTADTALVYRGGWLFVMDDSRQLRALRAADGSLVWTGAPLESPLVDVPTIDGTRVFAASRDGRITAWHINDGRVAWTSPPATNPTAVFASHGRVYLAAAGRLTAYRQTDGELQWSYRTDMPIVGPLAADDRHVYFTALDNSVRAHRPSNGHMVWKRGLEARAAEGLLADGAHVLVPQSDGVVRLLLAETGQPAGELAAPTGDKRGALLLAATGSGASLRLVRVTTSESIRTVEAFARQSLPVSAATTLTGTPLPLALPGGGARH